MRLTRGRAGGLQDPPKVLVATRKSPTGVAHLDKAHLKVSKRNEDLVCVAML